MKLSKVRFRVDFTDICSVGVGKIELLEAMARTGSLSQAAPELSMSYRRAWLLVDSMNREFDVPVVTTSVGGKGGGGVVLTEFGLKLIQAYRELELVIKDLAALRLRAIAPHALHVRQRAANPSPRQRINRSLA